MPTTVGRMLDKKQIKTSSGINTAALKSFAGASTKATTAAFAPRKTSSIAAEGENKKKSYSGGSMFNFFKQNQQNDNANQTGAGNKIKKELL